MNNVSELLVKLASDLRTSTPELVAIDMLKQAGVDEQEARFAVAQELMEKQAFDTLTYSGIDVEKAASMVKAANINVRELEGFDVSSQEEVTADLLVKIAAYVEALEADKAELLEKLAQAPTEVIREVVREVQIEAPEMPEPLAKLASSGNFTFEDLEALRNVSEDTLTKLASVAEEPWAFGSGSGMARPKTDPLLEFILG